MQILFEVLHVKSISSSVKDDIFMILHLMLNVGMVCAIERGMKGVHDESH